MRAGRQENREPLVVCITLTVPGVVLVTAPLPMTQPPVPTPVPAPHQPTSPTLDAPAPTPAPVPPPGETGERTEGGEKRLREGECCPLYQGGRAEKKRRLEKAAPTTTTTAPTAAASATVGGAGRLPVPSTLATTLPLLTPLTTMGTTASFPTTTTSVATSSGPSVNFLVALDRARASAEAGRVVSGARNAPAPNTAPTVPRHTDLLANQEAVRRQLMREREQMLRAKDDLDRAAKEKERKL